MLEVSIANNALMRAECFRVRQQVFAGELGHTGRHGFFEFLERDLYDDLPQTTHFLAYFDGNPVGTLSVIRGTDPLSDAFGLPLGVRWRIDAPGLMAQDVAQVPQSSVLREYRHLSIAVALWATAFRHALDHDLQYFFAEASIESKQVTIGHDIATFAKQGSLFSETVHCVPRHPSEIPEKSTPTEEPIEPLTNRHLPPIANLFFHLGGRLCGNPHYEHNNTRLHVPFAWRVKEVSDLHSALLNRLRNFSLENPSSQDNPMQ